MAIQIQFIRRIADRFLVMAIHICTFSTKWPTNGSINNGRSRMNTAKIDRSLVDQKQKQVQIQENYDIRARLVGVLCTHRYLNKKWSITLWTHQPPLTTYRNKWRTIQEFTHTHSITNSNHTISSFLFLNHFGCGLISKGIFYYPNSAHVS